MTTKVQQLMDDVREWGDATFGDRQQADGIVAHLKKEVAELHEDILSGNTEHAKTEFADCFMLFLEAASHSGLSVNDLVTLTYEKLEINKKRKWGKPDKDGSIQHIED